MWYSISEFIEDFHARVLDAAEFVILDEGVRTLGKFKKARVSALEFQDTPAMTGEEACRFFWDGFCRDLRTRRERAFPDEITHRVLLDEEHQDSRIEAFLAWLFTHLRPVEDEEGEEG